MTDERDNPANWPGGAPWLIRGFDSAEAERKNQPPTSKSTEGTLMTQLDHATALGLTEVTADKVNDLANGDIVLAFNGAGELVDVAERHQFSNSGENHGKFGWMLTEATTDAEAQEILNEQSWAGAAVNSVFPVRAEVIAAVGPYDDDDEAAFNGLDDGELKAILDLQGVGSVITADDIISVKLDGSWRATSCNWTPDEPHEDDIRRGYIPVFPFAAAHKLFVLPASV